MSQRLPGQWTVWGKLAVAESPVPGLDKAGPHVSSASEVSLLMPVAGGVRTPEKGLGTAQTSLAHFVGVLGPHSRFL